MLKSTLFFLALYANSAEQCMQAVSTGPLSALVLGHRACDKSSHPPVADMSTRALVADASTLPCRLPRSAVDPMRLPLPPLHASLDQPPTLRLKYAALR